MAASQAIDLWVESPETGPERNCQLTVNFPVPARSADVVPPTEVITPSGPAEMSGMHCVSARKSELQWSHLRHLTTRRSESTRALRCGGRRCACRWRSWRVAHGWRTQGDAKSVPQELAALLPKPLPEDVQRGISVHLQACMHVCMHERGSDAMNRSRIGTHHTRGVARAIHQRSCRGNTARLHEIGQSS